jgi:hypothetical protein
LEQPTSQKTNPKKSKHSRRKAQRAKHRTEKKEKIKKSNRLIHLQRHRLLRTSKTYGYISDPKNTLHKNFNTAIRTNEQNTSLPSNLTYHNLCSTIQPPPGTKELLGLNLNFCLASAIPKPNLKPSIKRLAYNIRTELYLQKSASATENDYHPQIYLKTTGWNPPPASSEIEDSLTLFEKALKNEIQINQRALHHKQHNNLNKLQNKTLKQLQNNNNFIIKPSDKNLGPAILNTDDYINMVLKEHLLTPAYSQLSKETALSQLSSTQSHLKNLINSNKCYLTLAEFTYFQRGFKLKHRIPLFYGLPKVHKSPVTLRPVVSCIGSFASIFSTWLDFKMKDMLPYINSYTKNSFSILEDLKDITLPTGALLFTADATSMYTNITTHIGLQNVKQLMDLHLPNSYPKELVLNTLESIMNNNIFMFGDTFWLQTSGTAMGTPVACSYATISYGNHENTQILPNFKSNLFYYRRYIDDILGIWLPSNNNESTWMNFKSMLNSFGSLKWVISNLNTTVNILDLNITINSTNKIEISTFQKEMNLHLYIPPSSAHPPSCLKGLIIGELLRYKKQNNKEDFVKIATSFLERMAARGHKIDELTPLFHEAAASIDKKLLFSSNTHNANPENNSERKQKPLYFHWKYHPYGISNSIIRYNYNKHLNKHLTMFDKMTMAISRPENLRDKLTRTALELPPGDSISSRLHTTPI